MNKPNGTTNGTPAARTASALLDLIKDPTTPEAVRLGLVAMLRGMASAVAQAVLDKPGREAKAKTVSEEQTLEHLPRWIATAEREGIRPQEGTLLTFVKGE